MLLPINLPSQNDQIIFYTTEHKARLTPKHKSLIRMLINAGVIRMNNLDSQLIFDTYCQVNLFKMKTTGEILRSQREFKGMLIRQVAAKLDIDTAILSKIERGERRPTRDQISKLAEILELNKDTLIIQFMSEKIADEIADEELGLQILKESEKKYKLVKK